MFSWSSKRQLTILLIPLVLVIGVSVFIYAKYFHQSPTCFDKVKNGDETGVDCGGSCQLVCSSDALTPVVLWAKSFNVTGNVWNSVAYVQNPNIKSSAKNVSYEFKLYDSKNILITSRHGLIDIPKNKTFAVFEGGLNVGSAVIKSTEFKFSDSIQWSKDESTPPELTITNNPIENELTAPKIGGTILNPTLQTISPIELIALIFDGRGNAIGVSKTIVDPLAKGQSAPFVFTWPHSFPVGVDVCQTPSNIMLVLDRSGSMASISSNPSEPLTDVKNTAINFLSQLESGDSAGVVSFATHSSNPIDQGLTGNLDLAKSAIQSMEISTSTTDQNTNIADGLVSADMALSSTSDTVNKKVIILLTDGVPTDPADLAKGTNFPTIYAENIADGIRKKGIDIYTIGLGQAVNGDILSNIAGSADRFFSAPDTNTLSSIYAKIANSICQRKPNVIEIVSLVL